MRGGEHIVWKAWQAVSGPWLWLEIGQRLLLLVGLLLLAKLLLALTPRAVRGALRSSLGDQRLTTLVVAVQSLIWYVMVLAVVLIGLYILGAPSSHLLTGLGVGGLAFALARIIHERNLAGRGRTGGAANWGAPPRGAQDAQTGRPTCRDAAADTVSDTRASGSERARWGCSRRQDPSRPPILEPLANNPG